MRPASILSLILLTIAFVGWSSDSASSKDGLRVLTDITANIRIAIPEGFPIEGKPTKWGRTWSSPDGGMTINSLAFSPGRKIEEIYARLTAIKGRVVTSTSTNDRTFILTGSDSDGNGFYISARQDGDTVRGFSIVYTFTRKNEYAEIIKNVASSFDLISTSRQSQTPISFRLITDTSAGIRLGMPTAFPVAGKATSWGHSWASGDGNIVIKSLAFQKGRKINDIYESLKDTHETRGWTIATKSHLLSDTFVFEAFATYYDTHLYIAARQDADTVRGFSIEIQSTKLLKDEDTTIVERVAQSFDIISSPASAPNVSEETDKHETKPSSSSCAKENEDFARLLHGATVSLSASNDLHAGDHISVHWQSKSHFPPKLPVYLVLAMPDEMRIEAHSVIPANSPNHAELGVSPAIVKGYIALTASARAPHDIDFGKGLARVLIPLHQPGSVNDGTFDVRPYRAGEWPIDYAFVAKTTCGERLLTAVKRQSFSVGYGSPKVVIQDPYPLDTPEHVIASNSGAYILHVFKDRYRLIEAETGALIADRAGKYPNFSPSSRYLSAMIGSVDGRGSEEHEIIDLISGEVIAHPFAELVGWTNGDSFLVTGRADWGSAGVSQPLVSDPTSGLNEILEVAGAPDDCHACRSWERVAFNINLDDGVVLFSQVDGTNASLCEIDGSYCSRDEDRARLKEILGDKYALKWPDRSTSWASLSYSYVGQYITELGIFHHRLHEGIQNQPLLAKSRAMTAKAGDWRGAVRPRSVAQNAIGGRSFFDQLSQFGVSVADSSPYKVRWPTPVWARAENEGGDYKFSTAGRALHAKELAELESSLSVDFPEIASIMGESTEFPYEGRLGAGKKLNLRLFLEGAWRWIEADKPIWLLYLHTFEGSAGNGIGALFILDSRRPTGQRVIGSEKGLEAPQSSVAELERRQVRLSIVNNRYIIYTSLSDANIYLYDTLEQRELTKINTGPRGNELLKDIRLSKDLRHVIQINTDGQFFFYETSTAEKILSGCFVDDEILLYTENGYFWSSYEGATLVHVRFPGMPGLHAFQQFASQLDKPQIIKDLLSGKKKRRVTTSIISPAATRD